MTGVIIPVYQARDTICKALDSLVAQTKKLFFVYPSIDGDGIDYEDIWTEYRRRGLVINPIVSEENGGPGIARQRAIDAAKQCEFLIFLDADDMLMPRAVEIISREMAIHSADLAKGNFLVEREGSTAIQIDVKDAPVTWMHGKGYRRQFLVDNDIRFLPNMRINEDSYFNVVAWNIKGNKIIIPEALYIWRNNKNSITRREKGKAIFEKVISTYVDTQTLGALKILEINEEINPYTLGAIVQNIYEHIMKQRFYKIEFDDYIPNLKKMFQNEKIQSTINTFEFWDYLRENMKQCEVVEDTFLFYKQNIKDFLMEYLNDNSN